MKPSQAEVEELQVLLDKELDVLTKENSVIFDAAWLEKLLEPVLDDRKWPEVSDITDNQFAQFIATAFKSTELVISICQKRFDKFLADPGETPEEKTRNYVKAMAVCEYAAYLARITYQNSLTQLNANIEAMVQSVTPKEDPNADLN